jgi:hypothetical protein
MGGYYAIKGSFMLPKKQGEELCRALCELIGNDSRNTLVPKLVLVAGIEPPQNGEPVVEVRFSGESQFVANATPSRIEDLLEKFGEYAVDSRGDPDAYVVETEWEGDGRPKEVQIGSADQVEQLRVRRTMSDIQLLFKSLPPSSQHAVLAQLHQDMA